MSRHLDEIRYPIFFFFLNHSYYMGHKRALIPAKAKILLQMLDMI